MHTEGYSPSFMRLSPLLIIAAVVFPVIASAQTACTREAKLCPDGKTYVGREGPNCEFAACPGKAESCAPYKCMDGTEVARCSEDGHIINYFAAPCHTHGGEAGAAATFSDVPSSHPNAEAIGYVQSLGIVEGYADGTFRPDQPINRAEFVKILLGNDFSADERRMCFDFVPAFEAGAMLTFMDVFPDDWFHPYVCVAHSRKMVQGYSDITFRPANNINFVEAAKIIVKPSFDFEMVESDFDVWYQPYVEKLAEEHAIPLSIRKFDQEITRGEMVEMMYRVYLNNLTSVITTKPTRTYEELTGKVADRETFFSVFFYTENDLREVNYEANFPVIRKVTYTSKVADAALRALFGGPTTTEYAQGARSNPDVAAVGRSYIGVDIYPTYKYVMGDDMVTLENVAVVNFKEDAYEYLNGAAATQLMVKAPIEATLRAFPTVDHVRYLKDGELYIEWDG